MTLTADVRTAGMRRQWHTQSETKHLAVRTAVEACVSRGLPESAAAIARTAGTTETFLYRHENRPCVLCGEIFTGGPISYYRASMQRIAASRDLRSDSAARVTAATTQAELANSRAATQRLRQQVRALERRLGELSGQQVQASLPELARLAQDVDPLSEQRIRQLLDQVAELGANLTERDEELQAVRRLNNDLTRRLNNITR